ncbi:hypothetical protein [Halogeometricum limi]|uniref:hypothetical protein n=1 Tax=Halogeometricum limi TaxID=555875 RepID=UPI0015879805|nr:hypothetical protein [Halogeometricum limi]
MTDEHGPLGGEEGTESSALRDSISGSVFESDYRRRELVACRTRLSSEKRTS